MRNPINYSQCWEDTNLVEGALEVRDDDSVLSVTSGGDNTLALLMSGASVVSIDMNPAQSFLLNLKWAAARNLPYDEYLAFLGVRESETRVKTFNALRTSLPSPLFKWWSHYSKHISRGVIHSGRFESFLNTFRKYLLPLVHNERDVCALFSQEAGREQMRFYREVWNTWRWRTFLRLATNGWLIKRFARQREMYVGENNNSTPDVFARRLERHLTEVPLRGNHYLRYCLTGSYGDTLPPYLTKEGYEKIRAVAREPHIITDSISSYLSTIPTSTFTKFNLSDIFESLTEAENAAVWSEIVRVAKHGARIIYWNNLVPRTFPREQHQYVVSLSDVADRFRHMDRVFFYGSFHVNEIRK